MFKCHDVRVIDSNECEIKRTKHGIIQGCVNCKLTKCSNVVLLDCINLNLENEYNVIISGNNRRKPLETNWVAKLPEMDNYQKDIREYGTSEESKPKSKPNNRTINRTRRIKRNPPSTN